MSKVAIFGSSIIDLMARNPHLPVLGEAVRDSMFKIGSGGKGFNQCVAARKAGAEVVTMTKVGRDSFANVTLDTMTNLGMDKRYISVSDDRETGVTLILVDKNTSQNEIIIIPGACNTIADEEVKSIENVIRESECVLLQLEVGQDANEMVMDMASRYGCKVIANTAPYSPVTGDFLSKAHMVTPNEMGAEELTDIPVSDLQPAKKAAAYLYNKGVQRVLITPGSRGVFVSSDGREEIVPAFKADTVDTAGTRNILNGGLLAALAERKDIWEAVRLTNGLAALSVQRLGTTLSMPSREEIDASLQSTQ